MCSTNNSNSVYSTPQGNYQDFNLLANLYFDTHGEMGNYIYSGVPIKHDKFLELLNLTFPNLKSLTTSDYFTKDDGLCYNYQMFHDEDKEILISLKIETKPKKYSVTEATFYFHAKNKEKVTNILYSLRKYGVKETIKNTINIVCADANGNLYMKSFEIKKPNLSLEDNYENITELYDDLLKRLNTKDDKGIVLFSGKPGGGKTSFIRFLLSKIRKTVIYLPPDMATRISSPEFIPFLMDYPNSVLVIEDAENVIKTREGGGSQSIANILNLGDGLLSDVLHIQIIATFNCDYKEIDEALLRKGRLICKHEFIELSTEKAQKLSDKLGFKTIINEPMLLSEIYNQDEKNYKTEKRRIGFTFKKSDIKTPDSVPALYKVSNTTNLKLKI